METVFLSYTYHPHPDHEANLDRLRGYAIRAIEAMGLRIIDGVDVGGRPLDDALRRYIQGADALIALVTPQANDAGDVVEPAFVLSEFQYAEGRGMPTMRVWHHLMVARGLGADNEYAPYRPGSELHVILKLMNTIALWRRDYARKAKVRIEPGELAVRYDEKQGDRCEFQVISLSGSYGEFERAKFWQDPGAAYALVKLREGERLRLRLTKDRKTWESGFFDPFIGGVRLEPVP